MTVMLLKVGVDLEAKDDKGQTALHLAAEAGHWGVTTALVNAEANQLVKTLAGTTPLHMAAEAGHSTASILLVRAGANIEEK